MASIRGLSGFGIIALLTLHTANLGETDSNALNEPEVPFPPACPTALNLAAICYYGQYRPRYPPSFFPASGVSHFRRRGYTINRLESWFSLCCAGNVAQSGPQILCCAKEAWKQALNMFCEEEYATMTVPYLCCEEKGDARWTCFNSELPNPYYFPTPGYTAPQSPQEPGFIFNSNSC
ncbi:extracellular matrix protein 1 [Mastacembelus armatus]|uniref:extracellular matrix protein 1 n=1 Tax=Mastacembelus armatus TaxID=205130 RepID=UPI000E4560AA|nr:extracellular matrix protein 1-like [Mastacembelus armatus]